MKFKVGDKVRVKNGLKSMERYGSETFVPSMKGMSGKIVTIKEVSSSSYELKETGYLWTDEMLEKVEDKIMTKKDLKDGMVVQYRNGSKNILINGKFMREDTFMDLCSYDDSLILERTDRNYDIMKIYNTSGSRLCSLFDDDKLTLIWQREEVKEMTVADIEKLVGCKVKIVKEVE